MADLKVWHKEVLERDNYTCRICYKDFSYSSYFNDKGINQFVCGHHMKSQGAHIDQRDNPDVGICVDLECHNKIHSGLIEINFDDMYEESLKIK